jgi:ferredoxin-NADP reductase
MDHEHFQKIHGSGQASMKKAAFEVALKSKVQIAEGTMAFVFEKPAQFTFRAGQHVRMTLPHLSDQAEGGNKRFLTLANTPQDDDLVIAMRMTGSAFKNALNEMQVGQKVMIEILLGVPQGAFALHDDQNIPAILIAGGIGIVPAYSMIKDWAQRKLAHRLTLFYSNRCPEDAPYITELQELARRNPSLKLIATMTDGEKSSTNWQGEIGVIDESMLRKYVADFGTPTYYISGMVGMVDEMNALVLRLGAKKGNVKAEEFSGLKMGGHGVAGRSWKKHLLPIAVFVAVFVVISTHVVIVFSLRVANFVSFQNQWLYIFVCFMIVLAALKYKRLNDLFQK